ncbi:hypothetical protein C7974DRAFT_143517 [Boeremia exigua]|uniref:uncharacterized protein n=1 Tax=Boeremia exigua TaxID=749465 RepID=UPI001E8E1F4F|nr:uncharacterized protein C7974DRAFT_143517 [Boeremia exigua]KAH6637555.1 hypothetical protein C7974DRAFT_143517 [Boeremia exigua]
MLQNLRRQFREAMKNIHHALKVAYSPSGVSHDIARSIVEATPADHDAILERFVKMKQRELATVLLSCALVASLIASLMSWNWFPVPPFTARIAALCALIHSVVAIGIASQQLIALTRAQIHPDCTKIMHHILFGSNRGNAALGAQPAAGADRNPNVGSGWRHFSWQIPTMLLGNSLVFTLLSLTIAIFHEASKAVVWQTPEMVTALCVAVSLAFGVSCYFISWFSIEWRMQEATGKDFQFQII